jgi:hypothetical protein
VLSINKKMRKHFMTFRKLAATALLVTSTSALAWTPYYGNGWGNNGNLMGDGDFGFSMNANARGNGNGWGNNGYGHGPYGYGPYGYDRGYGNGNFFGDGNFGFNMNAKARGTGNGWGNSYNGYNPYYGPAYYGPAYGAAPSQDQIEAQQKAQADYIKKIEEQRKAFFEAQKKAHDDYVAMMEKRYGKKDK